MRRPSSACVSATSPEGSSASGVPLSRRSTSTRSPRAGGAHHLRRTSCGCVEDDGLDRDRGDGDGPAASAACSHRQAVAVDMVGAAQFEAQVLESPVPVIVDFWAPWCRPCDAIEPHLVGLAAEWGERVRLVRVNVDEEAGLSARYGVLSLPTVVLFAGGEARATVYGAQS